MDVLQQQCHLAALGYYKLKRKDGFPAIDGIPGPATRQAVYNFQLSHGKREDGSVLTKDGIFGPATEKALRQVIALEEPPQVPQTDPEEKEAGIPDFWKKYPDVDRESWRCQCGGRFCNGFPVEPSEGTVALLQKFHDHFGVPIRRHSGIRCPGYNATIPGASPNSKHRLGMAYDFHMDGVSPRELYDFGEEILGDSGGLGLYAWGIHIDDRPVKGRW